MEDKRRYLGWFLSASIILTIVFIVIFALLLIVFIKTSANERAVYEQLHNEVVIVTQRSDDETNVSDGIITERQIDFDFLGDVNPIISSWIYIPDTVVDYPVVQGIDNFVYLERDAYGNTSSAGSIFLDCNNAPTYSDCASILYGHNKRDGSMFACLHDYTSAEFAASHSDLYIYLDYGDLLEYELLCTLKADAYDANIYSPGKLSRGELFSYLNANADAVYGSDNGTNLLLLSTCIRGDSRRIVVFQQKLLDE